jgi:hypothetical protein
VTGRPTQASPVRLAVFEALKVAAPAAFDDEKRRLFVEAGSNFDLTALEMDSLADMEFCIAIELSTGVALLPSQLAELASTGAIEAYLNGKLETTAGSGG